MLNRVLCYRVNTNITDSLGKANGHLITSNAEGWDGRMYREGDVRQTDVTTAQQADKSSDIKDCDESDDKD